LSLKVLEGFPSCKVLEQRAMATCGQTLHPMTRAMGQANDAAPWQCMAYTSIGGLKAGQGCLEHRVGMLGQC